MKKRVELCLLTHKNVDDFQNLQQDYDFANVYIKTELHNLSATRKKLIELNYTTRLFIVLQQGKKEEYIFGKLKGFKGVFNEHCKNSVFRKPISEVIGVSSNINDSVLIDNSTIQSQFTEERQWILI